MHTGDFDKDDYFATVAEATPGLTEMVKWCDNNPAINPEIIDDWNEALETGNLEAFYDQLEILMGMWLDAGKPGEVLSEEETVNKWFEELPQEVVDTEMATIEATNYTYEQADQMVELASQFKRGSVEHDILSAAVNLAYSKEDFNALSQRLFRQHGPARVAAAYMRLNEQLK